MRAAIVAAGVLAASPAAAQTSGWTFALSPYAWLPGISTSLDTDFGRVESDLSANDAVADLEFALMGAFEARNGRWGLILDLVYSDIALSEPTPFGRLFSRARVDTELTVFTAYAAYRLVETDRGSLDLLGGGRFYWLDVGLELTPGDRERATSSVDGDWGDPVFGARGRLDLTERWFATALVDAGGFGGSDQSWQAFGSVGYQFDPRWSVQAGWRHLSIEKRLSGNDVEVDLSGPLLGFTVRF
jgi:hypothetical protein